MRKYEKPIVRDLGASLPSAEGVCIVGSVATGGPGAHCIPFGGSASGAYCSEGQTPSTTGCTTGGTPTAHGCLPGITATIACSTGTGF